MKLKMYDTQEYSSLAEMLETSGRNAGGKSAFRYRVGEEIRDISYAEFVQDVYSLRKAMRDLGISGKHIACLSENRYEWVNTFLSCLISDNVFVPIDRDLHTETIINILNHSDSEVIFCSGQYEELIRENRNAIPSLRYMISFDRAEDGQGIYSYSALVKNGEDSLALTPDTDTEARPIDDIAMIIYTSGTTGSPKGVMLSESNILACVSSGLKLCKPSGVCLSMLRYSHSYEAVCGLLAGLWCCNTICINDSSRNIATNLKLYKPTYIYTVPAFLEAMYQKAMNTAEKHGIKPVIKGMIAAAKTADRIKLNIGKGLFASLHRTMGGSLKRIYCGGAPLRWEVAEFFSCAGIPVHNGYGLTECSPLVSVNPDRHNDCATAGYPLPCLEIEIRDPARDDNGEICVKGPTVMLGYYKNPEETAKVIREDGFLITGDRGHLTDKGQLVITGRSKDLIVLSNGRIVHPEEIEEYLYKIPYIKEVVVYGIREESGIKELCAEVYMDTESQKDKDLSLLSERLQKDVAHCMRKHPAYKQISRIVVRPQEFPKTSNNKIKRNELGI